MERRPSHAPIERTAVAPVYNGGDGVCGRAANRAVARIAGEIEIE